MTTSAPDARRVCQHTGEIDGVLKGPRPEPSGFFKQLGKADERIAEVEALREENAGLRCRIDELEAELRERNGVTP